MTQTEQQILVRGIAAMIEKHDSPNFRVLDRMLREIGYCIIPSHEATPKKSADVENTSEEAEYSC